MSKRKRKQTAKAKPKAPRVAAASLENETFLDIVSGASLYVGLATTILWITINFRERIRHMQPEWVWFFFSSLYIGLAVIKHFILKSFVRVLNKPNWDAASARTARSLTASSLFLSLMLLLCAVFPTWVAMVTSRHSVGGLKHYYPAG